MKKTLGYIATACGGILHPDSNPDRIVVGTYSDSRAVEVSKLFLAFKGASVDGNTFVPDVLAKGGCALIDREEYYEKDTVLVSDVRTALQRMARLYRDTELLAVPTVGITGSVGKTSTKDIVAHALSTFLRVHKTPANANSQVGLPQTVLDADSNDEVCVLELGMSMKGEMDRIAAAGNTPPQNPYRKCAADAYAVKTHRHQLPFHPAVLSYICPDNGGPRNRQTV